MEQLRSKSYCIQLKPIAWARAGYNSNTGFYDKQAREKLCYGIFFEKQHENEPKFVRPIAVHVTFYLPRPVNQPYNQRSKVYVSVIPDLDNYLKMLLDSMHGIIYDNDKIVCEIHAKKIYTNPSETRTEITITEIE